MIFGPQLGSGCTLYTCLYMQDLTVDIDRGRGICILGHNVKGSESTCKDGMWETPGSKISLVLVGVWETPGSKISLVLVGVCGWKSVLDIQYM